MFPLQYHYPVLHAFLSSIWEVEFPLLRLQYLQFETALKVNLAELSYLLEQELRTVDVDNAVYQAAVATYDFELRHLK